MLSICHDFGVNCDLSSNTNKSYYGLVSCLIGDIFQKNFIDGRDIPKTELLVYLEGYF